MKSFISKDVKGFIPYLLTNLVPLLALIISSILNISIIFHQNLDAIEMKNTLIINRANDIFTEMKRGDNALRSILSASMFNQPDLKSSYWTNPDFQALHAAFEDISFNYQYVDDAFIYIKSADTVLSKRGVQDSEMFYATFFTEQELKYETYKNLLNFANTSDSSDTFTDSYMDSDLAFFRTAYSSSNDDVALFYVIPKSRFYPEGSSGTYNNNVNIYFFDIKNNMVFNIQSYGESNITELSRVRDFPGSTVFEYSISVFSFVYTVVITFKNDMLIYMPVILIVAMSVLLIVNILFSIKSLSKLANNNYKPLININRLLNKGQVKYEYNIIEESIRSLIKTNETLENNIAAQNQSVRDFLLTQLINSEFPKDMEFLLEKYNLSFEYDNFIVITFLPHGLSTHSTNEKKFSSLLVENLQNLFNEYQVYHIYNDGKIIFVINTDQAGPAFLHKTASSIAYMINIMKGRLYVDVSIGISEIHSGYLNINLAYLESLQAVYHTYEDANSTEIHIYDDIKNNSGYFDKNFESKLLEYLTSGDIDKILHDLDDIFSKIKYMSSKRQYEEFYKLSCILIKIPATLNLDKKDTEMFHKSVTFPVSLHGIEPFQQKIEELLTCTAQKLNTKYRANISNKIVNIAIEYTQAHYDDANLSLTSICEYLGYTNNYFSALFKKETGMSWNDYLHRYRIEQAKKYLISGLSVNETYKKCGYLSLRTFNRVFKKFVNSTATEYRKNIL